jgi:hypothetical protein
MGRKILRAWRYSAGFRRVHFGGNQASVRAEQPMIWLVLTQPGVQAITAGSHPHFPAILDTGYAGRLLLNVRHVASWTGLAIPNLVRSPTTETVFDQRLARYEVTAWLLPIDPAIDAAAAYSQAVPLKIQQGMSVMDHSAALPWNRRPETPLLGLSALADNHIVMTIDARARSIDLETNRRW